MRLWVWVRRARTASKHSLRRSPKVNQPLLQARQAQDHEQVALVDVDLGPLHHLDDVLERERMQAIALADRAHRVDVTQALDVDPDIGDAAHALRSSVWRSISRSAS
jgi:hypothetical protein